MNSGIFEKTIFGDAFEGVLRDRWHKYIGQYRVDYDCPMCGRTRTITLTFPEYLWLLVKKVDGDLQVDGLAVVTQSCCGFSPEIRIEGHELLIHFLPAMYEEVSKRVRAKYRAIRYLPYSIQDRIDEQVRHSMSVVLASVTRVIVSEVFIRCDVEKMVQRILEKEFGQRVAL